MLRASRERLANLDSYFRPRIGVLILHHAGHDRPVAREGLVGKAKAVGRAVDVTPRTGDGERTRRGVVAGGAGAANTPHVGRSPAGRQVVHRQVVHPNVAVVAVARHHHVPGACANREDNLLVVGGTIACGDEHPRAVVDLEFDVDARRLGGHRRDHRPARRRHEREGVDVGHPLDDAAGRAAAGRGRQSLGCGDRAAVVVDPEAVASRRLTGLDLAGDDGDVVLQTARRVAGVADEPLVDALGVVDAHDRTVERVEARGVFRGLGAEQVVVGLVVEAEVVAKFVGDAGDPRPRVAVVVERLSRRVGKHAHVAVAARNAGARHVPGERHRRLLCADIDVEDREVDGDLPPRLGDRRRLRGVERCRITVYVVGGVGSFAVEVEVDRGWGPRQAVQNRQPVDGGGRGDEVAAER